MYASRIQQMLQANKIPTIPERTSEPNDLEDGQVVITEKVHVQVGHWYMNVVVENDDGTLTFRDQVKTDMALMMEIKAVLA